MQQKRFRTGQQHGAGVILHALDSRSFHKVAHGSLSDAHAKRHEVERAHNEIVY